MNSFIKFFNRFSTFFLFLLLEITAFAFVVNQSVFQKSFFAKTMINATAAFYEQTNNAAAYFLLRKKNDNLSAENAALKEKINALENFIESKNYENLLPQDSAFKILPAKIVSKSVDKINNYLIINKGKKDGVIENMGVVNFRGVVGIVQTVSENYSVALSLLSADLNISGKFKKNNYLCSVFWNGLSAKKGSAQNIPEHCQAAVGDTIITSGFSSIFPENIMIGVVKKVSRNPKTAWNDLEIDYSTDFVTANYVNVLVGKNHDELMKLTEVMQ
jgi:rod shape-determining protein MreC